MWKKKIIVMHSVGSIVICGTHCVDSQLSFNVWGALQVNCTMRNHENTSSCATKYQTSIIWHEESNIKSAYKPSGPSGWSQLISISVALESTRGISTPPGCDASPQQGYPQHQVHAQSHLYTWVERGTVRVNCLAQECHTMSPARARTWTADHSRVEHTNHEATVPPTQVSK